MPIITLTTDWQSTDFYAGAIKGKILSLCPSANIIDISHNIQTFNFVQAAFIIKNSYKNFPEGTIHIICINSEQNETKPFIVLKINKQYFIGADTGIFGLIFDEQAEIAIKIKNNKTSISTFPEFDIFAEAAANLANGKQISELGDKIKELNRIIPLRPTIDDNIITGKIVYIDSYKNAITNISKNIFDTIGKNRKFEITIKSNLFKINKINNTYHETSAGEILAIFNSLDYLEIAMNHGNLCELLNLDTNSIVRIVFSD
ncbi:MAG: SAM-dependent chlorinase/fluorinase [Bacteroidales bacterium]|nr:SAM-dependent chlorinase/fluorinase [Bacteroidales bacterium]